jgi:hypothetical protein
MHEKSWAEFQKVMEQEGSKKYKPMVLICEREVENDDDEESEFFYVADKEVFSEPTADDVDEVVKYLRYAALGLKDEH